MKEIVPSDKFISRYVLIERAATVFYPQLAGLMADENDTASSGRLGAYIGTGSRPLGNGLLDSVCIH